MSTSIADLLDALSAQASNPIVHADSSDADRALALLGRVLQRTVDDGLTQLGASDRERWVGEAAWACAESAVEVRTATPGRLSQLAGAAWDVVSVQRADLGCENRWAIAIAVVDVVSRLTTLVDQANVPVSRRRALIVADACASIVQRSAAIEPPSPQAAAALDRAVPRPIPDRRDSPATAIREAAAGLEHATRPGAIAMTIADYVSVAIALKALCRSVPALITTQDAPVLAAALATGQGWAAARAVLKPFDDGSRRPHAVAPPAVAFALAMRDGLRRAQADLSVSQEVPAPVQTAICDALQRVPTIAANLTAAVTYWADTGCVVGYSRDLGYRESRVSEYLAGFRITGLVIADVTDLRPTADALDGAKMLSVDLAGRVADRGQRGLITSRFAAANQYARTEISSDRLHAASMDARRALQAHAGPPRAARGPHR
jgi:hypothetical protein